MIINAGLGMVERDMVSFFVEQFVKMRSEAEEIMSCYQQPGPFSLGIPLVRSYLDLVRKRAEIYCQTTVAQLLIKDNVCNGALCVDESTSETFGLYGKAVILAAGGDAGLFSVNVHPECVSGDGYALGLRAGAEAINLEFMQIFTMTTAPTRNLIHFVNEEHLSSLYNSEGKEFLSRYLPDEITMAECIRENTLHAPFSARDKASRYLAVGIVEEIRQSAWDNLLVIKSKSSINSFDARIDEICQEARKIAPNPGAVPLEVENLLTLGKALAKTALERKESRGGFYREDYPYPAQGRPEAHVLTLSDAGEVALRKEVLDPQWNPDFEDKLDKERWG